MGRHYKTSIPRTIGEVHVLLGFIMLKSPTFEDPIFPGRNAETTFFELNEGLAAIRREIGEKRFHQLTALSDRVRAHFEADPTDSNGEAREGRKLIQDMEAIVLSVARSSAYPEMDRGELVALATRLRMADGTTEQLDTITDRLLTALPHSDVMALLFDRPELTVEEAIDEALRIEHDAVGSKPA